MQSVDLMLTKSLKQDFWSVCLQKIEDEVTTQQYHTWFDGLQCKKIEDGTLYLTVESSFTAEWVQGNYKNLLLSIVKREDPSISALHFSVEMRRVENPAQKPAPLAHTKQSVNGHSTIPVVTDILRTPNEMHHRAPQAHVQGLMREFTFENFVKAENNELICAAAKNVAQAPGRHNVNPLIVYGGTGMGKTHLLHAIGNHAARHQTASRILYRTSDRFISDFIKKVSKNNTKESFLNAYKNIDILLIDDIQFLAKKPQTQIEFYKIFETMLSMNKQIVITCDKDPNEVVGLNERLLHRFGSGLAASVLPTTYETRLEILKQKISQDPGMKHFSIEILQFIAEKCVTNIRELEGALTRLFAYSSLMGKELTLEVAKSVLMGVASKNKQILTIQSIIEAVASECNVESDALCSQSRLKVVAQPRKMAMYLARHLTGSTLHTIAAHFNRDYSTVIHAIKSFEKELTKDASLNHTMQKLKSYLKAP